MISMFLFNATATSCERRIVNGHAAFDDHGFVVYLVKSNQTKTRGEGWICGGCIITPLFILTAASCVIDMDHVYAIAGYRKYVTAENIEKNRCTHKMKKRVISYCVNEAFDEKKKKPDWWNWMDIGLARVDSPYNFEDPNYIFYCHYSPKIIPLNYETVYQQAGTDVVSFGWGSTKYYRPVEEYRDNNEEYLRYASSVIMDRNECRKEYDKRANKLYHKHTHVTWICTYDMEGRLDENGILLRTARKMGLNDSGSLDNVTLQNLPTRRHGSCQNDHGGPLITWINGKPFVIGVATAFLVDSRMRCQPPYAYTSVACHNKFIYNILNSTNQSQCNVPLVRETNITWA